MIERTDDSTEDDDVVEVNYFGKTITSRDAADFMNEVAHGDQSCPVCKETSWEMNFGAGDGSFPVLPSAVVKEEKMARPEKPMRFPVYGVVCATCGYMRLHALQTLANWVEGKTE